MPEQHQGTFQRRLRHVPQLSPETWTVIIDGFVQHSLTLDYNTLRAHPATTSQQLLLCAGHTAETPLAVPVRWRGVALEALLGRVVAGDRARYLNIHSADGYATSLPLAAATGALLAYEMNGAPLPPEHGYPARLVAPARYGYKQPKWVQHIILSDRPVAGHWERQGRDTSGVATPTATLAGTPATVRAGEPLALGGLTNAPHVEIQVDGGPWNPVTVTDRLAWRTTWTPALPGIYRLQVRARAGDTTQPNNTQPVIIVEATI